MRTGLVFFCLLILQIVSANSSDPFFDVYGMRIENTRYRYNDYIVHQENELAKFLIVGENLGQIEQFSFVRFSQDCSDEDTLQYVAELNETGNPNRLIASVDLPSFPIAYKSCVKLHEDDNWYVVPTDEFRVLQDSETELYMPIAFQIATIVLLLPMSGFFSGVTVSIFSLSIYHLRLLSSCSEGNLSVWAANILPLRKQANLLLSTLVLGNVSVNNLLTLLIDNTLEFYVDKEWKYAFSIPITLCLIMTFGEIIPQAVGIRYCLRLVSGTRYITIFFIVLFFPLAWPISKVLDLLVGETGRNTYNCDELKAIVEHHQGQQQDKALNMKLVELIVGAYKLPEYQIKDVMTPLDKVYMLDENTLMTEEVCKEIHNKGHTRIPLYQNGDKNMIGSILNVKDLAAFIPNCGVRLGFIARMFHRNLQIRFVLEDMNLMKLLRMMKRGHPIVFVMRFNDQQKDYEISGLITVEDIIEEIIGEINDEKDARRRDEQVTQIKIFEKPIKGKTSAERTKSK